MVNDPDDGVPQTHALFLGKRKLGDEIFVTPDKFVYLASITVFVPPNGQQPVSEDLLVCFEITQLLGQQLFASRLLGEFRTEVVDLSAQETTVIGESGYVGG